MEKIKNILSSVKGFAKKVAEKVSIAWNFYKGLFVELSIKLDTITRGKTDRKVAMVSFVSVLCTVLLSLIIGLVPSAIIVLSQVLMLVLAINKVIK